MIYIDSSVVLAELLDEERTPPPLLWRNYLVSSRLAHYEVWTSLNRAGLGTSHKQEARAVLERLTFVDMLPHILRRALEPFPMSLRTLDALHLATVEFLRGTRNGVELASYDGRLIACARALDVKIAEL